MKIIFKKPSKKLYSIKLLPLSKKFIFELIFFFYKIKHILLKTTINLITNFTISNYNTRNSNNLRQTNFIKSLSQKSIFYQGLQLFNNLPNSLKDIIEISKFQTEIKSYVFSNYQSIYNINIQLQINKTIFKATMYLTTNDLLINKSQQ